MADTRFGRYRLQRLLGEGGMGQVWSAYDTDTNRTVALKLLPAHLAADPEFRERFRREAHAAAQLREPHVIPIHGYGEIEGRLYLDMRLVDGIDVKVLLARDGPLPPPRAVTIIDQVAAALDAAHAEGLVHRDVKPANILVCTNDFAYLIDFGIARAAGESVITRTGVAVGTFSYMSPERLTTGLADPRTDVYALTGVLHECLTGAHPYPGDSVEQQITAHLTFPPPRPSLVLPRIPAGFDEVIARGMAKNPHDRYPTAGELAAAARGALVQHPAAYDEDTVTASGPEFARRLALIQRNIPSRPPSPPPPSPPPAPRPRRRWIPILAAVLAVVAAGIAYWTLTERDGTRDAGPATTTQAAGPATTVTVTATIPVGKSVTGVAVDPETHTVYTANSDGTVSMIDASSRTVTATIAVGKNPAGVAVDPSTRTVYVTNRDDGMVSVIDAVSRTVTATIPVGKTVTGVAVDPGSHTVYTANYGDSTVSVIDAVSRTVTATIPVGKNPDGVAVDLSTHTVYVTNSTDGTVSVIDAVSRTVTATIPVGKNPARVAVDPDTHTVYVTNFTDRTVSVIDAASRTVTATIATGKVPFGVTVDPGAHTVYVANYDDVTVSVIDAPSRTVTATIAIGRIPFAVTVDPGTHTVYTANGGDGTVSVIEASG